MNFIKKQALNLSLLLSTMAPLVSNAQTETVSDDKNKTEVSGFANLSVRNGYYFVIGPLAGIHDTPKHRSQNKFVTQGSFGFTKGNLTLSTWFDYVPMRGDIDEIDLVANYDLGSKDFKLGEQPFTLAGTAGIMAFTYPDGSQAGGAPDLLPNANVNISTPIIGDKKTSLNLFYMQNVVPNKMQAGGALLTTLEQEIGSWGPVSVSANAFGAYGAGLYDFKGSLLGRLGTNVSVDLGDDLTLSGDYSYQFTGPDQDKDVIPQESIFGLTLSKNF